MVVPLKITYPSVKYYFKEIPFYNRPIEAKNQSLKKVDLLAKLPFFEKLSIVKTN